MITIKSRGDLEKLREAGRVAAQALELAGKSIRPGMTTYQLDKILHDFIVHCNSICSIYYYVLVSTLY